MGKRDESVRTIVVPCGSTVAALDRGTGRWHSPRSVSRSFGDLGVKYPGLCRRLANQFLESSPRVVTNEMWSAAAELKGVVFQFREALKKLGCSETVIETVRNGGYELNEGFVREVPTWLVSEVDAVSIATAPSTSHSISTPELPPLRSFAHLVELVRARKWTLVPFLPGNGAEEVVQVLRRGFPEARVVTIDIATISDGSALNENIAGDEVADVARAPAYRVARAAARSSELLVMVVRGWGAHAQMFGLESLTRIAEALHAFTNVQNPEVVVVLLSPTPTSHLIPPAKDGSLLGLTSVVPYAADEDLLTSWAREHLSGSDGQEVDALLAAAAGQLGAIRAALFGPRSNPERLQAISTAHAEAGLAILASLGPCCVEVLGGAAGKSECVRVLAAAGILERGRTFHRPRVQAWTKRWGALRQRQ